MITAINFGASPFRALFFIVVAIFIAVLISNIIAGILTVYFNWRTRTIISRK